MKKPLHSLKTHQPRSSKKPVKLKDETMIRNAESTADTQISYLEGDIISLILLDHEPLKVLIQTLKDSELEKLEKVGAFEKFVPLLMGHAKSEEQSLYVEMKEFSDLRSESFEGDTEHAIADQLVQEINACPDDDEWQAKVKVLAELVEHHIQEEEEHILHDVAEKLDGTLRLQIGQKYTELKDEFDSLNKVSRFSQNAASAKFTDVRSPAIRH